MLKETYGHINSTFCDGMVTTITAAQGPTTLSGDVCMPACKLYNTSE